MISCSVADIFSWINLVRTRSETSLTELSRIDSEAAGYGAALYLVWMFGMYLCGESYMARVIKTVMILLGFCWVSLLLAVKFWENTFEHISLSYNNWPAHLLHITVKNSTEVVVRLTKACSLPFASGTCFWIIVKNSTEVVEDWLRLVLCRSQAEVDQEIGCSKDIFFIYFPFSLFRPTAFSRKLFFM